MLGTTSVREPSGLARSIAMPRLTCSGCDQGRLAVDLGERVVHLRVLGERLHQGVPDQVGEADLAAAPAGEVVVDHDAVVGEELRRHRAHARRGRHLQRRVHVLHDPGGDAADRRGLRAAGRGPAPSRRFGGLAFAAGCLRPPAAALPRAGCWPGGDLASAAAGSRTGVARRRARPAPGRRAALAVGGRIVAVAACSRRRSRARPGRRSPGRPGTAGTCPRRSTRSGRSPPTGCPASSSLGSTRPLSPLPMSVASRVGVKATR